MALLRHIEAADASRAQLGAITGWARMTVNARLDELLGHGLIEEGERATGSRGRPAARFAFAPHAGRVLIAAIGASGAHLAVCDLGGRVIDRRHRRTPLDGPPEVVLPELAADLADLADVEGAAPLWGVGVSLPAPVEAATGTVVSPPILSGWDGAVVPEWFDRFGVPVIVLKDADAMAWGEAIALSPRATELLAVKVGTGIGAGIVANGRPLLGANGAAGDLGHTFIDSPDGIPPLCRCGKRGCVESYAGGWAIARDLRAAGVDASGVGDVVDLVVRGDPVAVDLVRRAGRVLGAGIAQAVSMLNPAEVVVVGPLAVAGEHLLAGIRECVASRSLPLATRDLRIRVGTRALDADVYGAADAVISRIVFRDG